MQKCFGIESSRLAGLDARGAEYNNEGGEFCPWRGTRQSIRGQDVSKSYRPLWLGVNRLQTQRSDVVEVLGGVPSSIGPA